jgi:hypothetical protein
MSPRRYFEIALLLVVAAIAVWVVIGWVTADDGPPEDLVFFALMAWVAWTWILAPRLDKRKDASA